MASLSPIHIELSLNPISVNKDGCRDANFDAEDTNADLSRMPHEDDKHSADPSSSHKRMHPLLLKHSLLHFQFLNDFIFASLLVHLLISLIKMKRKFSRTPPMMTQWMWIRSPPLVCNTWYLSCYNLKWFIRTHRFHLAQAVIPNASYRW